MYVSARVAPATWRALIAGLAILAACSGATSDVGDAGPTTPVTPTPPAPKPAIVLSTDSVAVTLLSGAGAMTQEIDVTPANATSVTGLAIADLTAIPSQSAWLSVSLSAETAPAKLMVRVSPAAVPAGRYDATLRLTSTNAETRTVRVSLVVRPRPRLVLERTTLALAGDVGSAFAPDVINVSSVDGSIDGLRVSQPDCATGPAGWLTPTLTATSAPAVLRLSVAATSLAAGTYTCSLTVSTSQTLVDSASQTVRVSLVLRAVPRIALSTDTLVLTAYRLSDAEPASVSITNAGSGTLSGLSVGPIAYDTAASGWLTAKLDAATAPAGLSIVASARSVGAGTFVATLPIQSTAEGVGNAPKPLVVKFTVFPRPSFLVAAPSTVNVTVRAGFTATATVSVTHSGDSPLNNMAFGQQFGQPGFPYLSWVSYSLGCTGAVLLFYTPCTGHFFITPPASLAPGTYTSVVPYFAYAERLGATVTLNVKVTP